MSDNRNEEFDNYQRALFREVSEDVEKEQFMRFWRKHGKKTVVIVGSVLFVVFSVLGYVLYKEWKTENNALVYAKALDESLYQPDKAEAVYKQLVAQDSDGFALLSKIQLAATMIDKGQEDEGFAELKTISNDTKIPMPFRNLSSTILAYHLLDIDGKEAEIIEIVTPLMTEKSLWRGSAREIMALSAIKEGATQKAKDLLVQNVNDANLPDSFKIRAKEMLSVMK